MQQDTIFKKRALGNSKYDSKGENFNELNNKTDDDHNKK